MKTLMLFVLTLSLAAFARAGANLSAETRLPVDERSAHEPAAAFGAGKYLVVWRAGRNENADLVGVRLDAAGKVLDAKPFVISKGADVQEQPAVAFGGGNFLVVWADLRSLKDYNVRAARVSPDGKVLDPDGVVVCAEPTNQCAPDVAFDGAKFVVVWQDFRNGKEQMGSGLSRLGHTYETFATYISPAGQVSDPKGIPVLTGSTHMFPAVVARSAGEALVASERGFGLFCGKVLGKKEIAPYPGKRAGSKGRRKVTLAAASSRDNYLIIGGIFQPIGRGGNPTGKEGTFIVDAAGKITKTIGLTAKKLGVFRPDAAWDGSNYVVAWGFVEGGKWAGTSSTRQWDAVYASRIAKDGKVLEEKIDLGGSFESPIRLPALASDGKGTTLVAYERHPKTADVPIKIAFRLLRAK